MKRKRGRARKVGTVQESRCGCGNVYSCSSALSLHIKNKHDGYVPEGSVGYPSTYRRNTNKMEESQKNMNYTSQTQQNNINTKIQSCSQVQNQMIDNNWNLDIDLDENPYDQNKSNYCNDTLSMNPSQSDGLNAQPRKVPYIKKYKSGNRQYVTKRIYMCGSCLFTFAFSEELMLHIKQNHKAEIPDGTIFGLKRQALLKFFHIATPKSINPFRKMYVAKCGCGKVYTCSSSLYYHIKAVHGGCEPAGTIGTTRA